jgi:hypothetical protein
MYVCHVKWWCHVEWWCMLPVNWNSVYHLVCLECRKCTSKYTCEHRIVLTVVWGSTEWVWVGLPGEVMVVDCYTCRCVGQMSRLAQHTGKK